jgi:hypothetical protein
MRIEIPIRNKTLKILYHRSIETMELKPEKINGM